MIKKIIILLLVFFILYLTLYLNKEKFQTSTYYDPSYMGSMGMPGYQYDPSYMGGMGMSGYQYDPSYMPGMGMPRYQYDPSYMPGMGMHVYQYDPSYMPGVGYGTRRGTGVVRRDTTSVSITDNSAQSTTMVSLNDDSKSGVKSDGNMCGLSTQEYSCLIEDGCKWNKDKCEPNITPKICGEIINEDECNSSNLKCIFDNSKNRCFKERNYFFDDKTSNNNNNNVNYEYYDRDCESLRQRGHDVYCTYDKDSINDDSLYFNLDRTIDLEKKRYKTCYDEDCMDTSNNKNKN
jgi:hypothetical protein